MPVKSSLKNLFSVGIFRVTRCEKIEGSKHLEAAWLSPAAMTASSHSSPSFGHGNSSPEVLHRYACPLPTVPKALQHTLPHNLACDQPTKGGMGGLFRRGSRLWLLRQVIREAKTHLPPTNAGNQPKTTKLARDLLRPVLVKPLRRGSEHVPDS